MMGSSRIAFGLPARPNDGPRPRMRQSSNQSNATTRPTDGAARKDGSSSRIPSSGQALTKPTTRFPQSASQHSRPSIPLPSARQWSSPQPHGLGARSAPLSSRGDDTHTQTSSTSSTSSRSQGILQPPAPKVLRRKKSSVSRPRTGSREQPSHSKSSSSPKEPGSAVEQAMGNQSSCSSEDDTARVYCTAESLQMRTAKAEPPSIYPELDRYRNITRPWASSGGQTIDVPYKLATQDLPPPTPASLIFSGSSSQLSTFSGSPSTKFSGSPGPGPYSRDTTPTSISSQSPNLTAPNRFNQPKGRINSPAQTRPPVSRRRAGSFPKEVDNASVDPQGLAAVRESLNSSSSSSTVKDGDASYRKGKKQARRLPPPPPSPPPRKSSQKFRQNEKPEEQTHEQGLDHYPAMPLSSPPKMTDSFPPSPSMSPKLAGPSRPSRKGTPDMQSQLFNPVPVIHSNLSSQFLPGERRGSEPAVLASSSRPSRPSLPGPRNASTSNLPTEKDMTTKHRTKTSVSTNVVTPDQSRLPTRTPSPNVNTSNSRFMFFGRKKTTTDTDTKEKKSKKEKSVRKGPAAGTGHEGYGKLGAIRRRSGGASNFARGHGPQSSQESLASDDQFLADRMNPVVISGGEIVSNRNASSELSRTESNQSIANSLPSTDSKVSSEMSSTSVNGSRTSLWPSAFPRGRASPRRPSDSSDSDGPAMKSTLAFRRSVHRLKTDPHVPLRLPQPISTGGSVSSPMTSFDTSIMSDDSHLKLQQELRRGGDPVHPAPKKLTKRPRSPRKWNLFGKSQNANQPKKGHQESGGSRSSEKKPMAYYTMMDASEQEDGDAMDIKEVLRNADVYPQSPHRLGTPDSRQTLPRFSSEDQAVRMSPPRQPQREENPSAAETFREQRKPQDYKQEPHYPVSSGRPIRLAQVGRIPKVVSNRPDHVSPPSYSRPFRTSLQPPSRESQISLDSRDTPATVNAGRNAECFHDGVQEPTLASRSEHGDGTCDVSQGEGREFLVFSPRKNSDGTIFTSSSSSGGNLFAVSTAVIPDPEDPPAEDEVWDEYDDLIPDENMKAPPSATSSKGIPFHLEMYGANLAKESSVESPTVPKDPRLKSVHSMATTRSSSYSADMTERIRTAFQPHNSPIAASPPSPNLGKKRSQSLDMGKKVQQKSRRSSTASCSARGSQCSSSSSDEGSPLSQVNLRVGSMTVSKWLTFGHVLFSDSRHELVPGDDAAKRQTILVIDGLGNDDWSFYAAETYPAATFFNLSPRAPLPAELQATSTSFPLSPANHHQVQYLSHTDKFPFAAQSFNSVVYRFPVAADEASYRNILTEARRVLKPGGYLELSILDADLNNMGNRGRRVVRDLKERIHDKVPETHLASTADLLVRLLGKVGFTGIKAARVGVPVASSVARSNSDTQGKKDSAAKGSGKKRDKPSLAEMMSEDGPGADEGITKMVAKVGRWWYTRCYENAIGYQGKNSIWNDKRLLMECEELGTSLRLMVCCARAPERITSC